MINKRLQELYPKKYKKFKNVSDIPTNEYMVYVLEYKNKAIVTGHGKRDRAKVIFDDLNNKTFHMKALLVRLYVLYGQGTFNRFIIKCKDKAEAQKIEKNLHKIIGGNSMLIPEGIRNYIFTDIKLKSKAKLFLELALLSSYDGLSDLRKWKKYGLVDKSTWEQISEELKLDQLKRRKTSKSVSRNK